MICTVHFSRVILPEQPQFNGKEASEIQPPFLTWYCTIYGGGGGARIMHIRGAITVVPPVFYSAIEKKTKHYPCWYAVSICNSMVSIAS